MFLIYQERTILKLLISGTMKQEHWIYTSTWHVSTVPDLHFFCHLLIVSTVMSQISYLTCRTVISVASNFCNWINTCMQCWCHLWDLMFPQHFNGVLCLAFAVFQLLSKFILHYFSPFIFLTVGKTSFYPEAICFLKTCYVPVFCIIINSRLESYVTILNNL
jgi:hypothetical protein